MTDEKDDGYDSLCPDEQHIPFERGAQTIADLAAGIAKEWQSMRPPSKVIRELEQVSNSLRKLSPEAQSSLWEIGGDGSFYSPYPDMLGQINVVLSNMKKGRPQKDEARYYLGTHAAALWCSHGGNLKADDFETFLQNLIEKAGFDGNGKVRIDSAALAEQMRQEYRNCDPPRWDPYAPHTPDK
jgi:hypothetical protein